MKRFKQYSSFFAFKAIRPFFTFAILFFTFSSLYGQETCKCQNLPDPNNPNAIFTIVGDGGTNIPKLSLASTSPVYPFDPTVPFPGGCIRVFGTFIIDMDWDVSNTEFVMSSGAEIIIDPEVEGVDVRITESFVHGCFSGKLWKSITLKNPESSLTITNCTIRDGEYAINLPTGGVLNTLTNTYDLITIQDNDFISNYVGIFSPPNSPNNLKQFMTPNDPPIIDNLFKKGDNDLSILQHYDPNVDLGPDPYAGIYMHDCSGFRIGLDNGQSLNDFNNLRHGVIFRNTSNCVIGGADISDLLGESIGVLTTSSNETQTQIRNCNMTNLDFGVSAINSGSLILLNTIDVNNQGVRIANANNINNVLLLNNITSLNHGINAVNVSNTMDGINLHIHDNIVSAYKGIRLFNVTGKATLENNNLTIVGTTNYSGNGITIVESSGEIRVQNENINFTNTTTVQSGVGIVVDNSETCQFLDNNITVASGNNRIGNGFRVTESENNLYCCNNIDETGIATYFIGTCSNTRYRTTTYGNNDTGLRLFDSMIGTQVNPGNNFAGGNLNKDAVFVGPLTTVSESLIITDDDLMTDDLNNVLVVGGDAGNWFALFGTDPSCQETPFCSEIPYSLTGAPGEGYQLTPNDIEISKYHEIAELNGALIKWEAQSYLFKKLKKSPSLISTDNHINDFFNKAKTGKISKFYSVDDGIQSLFIPSSSQLTSLADLKLNINNLISELTSIEQNLTTASGSEKLSLEQARNTKLAALKGHQEEARSLRTQIKQDRLQQVNLLLSLNQNLEPELVYQENEKITNQIFLETIGQDIFEFSNHQQKIINSIADQCVTEGGKGVVRARALQQFYMTKEYDGDSGCGSNSNARIVDTEKQKISIYPNPTFGEFSIQFEYPTEENLELGFYNLNGQLLFQKELYRGTFNYTFQDMDLESGIYICKIKSELKDVLTQKVVINKF